MTKLRDVKNLKVFMSSLSDLYKSDEDRANTAFDPGTELYKIRKCLKKSRDYWVTEIYTAPSPLEELNDKFYAWLELEYGLQVKWETQYGINGISGYTVLDEHKFMMFMLKFQ